MKRFSSFFLILILFISASFSFGVSNAEETFDSFYTRFRKDIKFQQERIVFPLKRISFNSERNKNVTDSDVEKYTRKWIDGTALYPTIHMVERGNLGSVFPRDTMNGDEKEGYKKFSSDTYESYIDLKNGFRALTYRFIRKNGLWYLVEYEDIW